MIALLKESVELRFGRKISYPKDCISLSNSVKEVTGEMLSAATLRRFFGLLATNSNPSRVTLDVLAKYAGFLNFNDFCNKNTRKVDGNKKKISEIWDIIVGNSNLVSRNTIERIRSKSGIGFESAVNRDFVEERFRTFLSSEFSATAIVAPGGYGKSTLLAKWYLMQVNNQFESNDAIFFTTAQVFEQYASTDYFIESWFLKFIGLKPDSNFLSDYLTSPSSIPPGKLIVVIDALDELTVQGAKQEKVYKGILDLINLYTKNGCLKFIFSTRTHNWENFSKSIVDFDNWCYVNPENFSIEKANIPALYYDEIQRVFDESVNRQFAKRLLVYELPFDVGSVITYPYFLQLFVQIYNPENVYQQTDQISIINEFLKKQVYLTSNADEKFDILNFILIKTNYGATSLLKKEIKLVFPIHLKLSGNYYSAYAELLSYGIIQEDIVIDSIGGYSCYVKISNQHIASVLAAQCIIREQGGITQNLFLWLQENLRGYETQTQIIEVVFKFACKEGNVEALLNFFDLDESLIEPIIESDGVSSALRADQILQNKLIPIYMKKRIARKLLVENSVDLNHIVTSYLFLLTSYLQYAETDKEKFFAKTFMVFSGFLTLNANLVETYIDEIKTPDVSALTPKLAAAWYSNMLFNNFITNGKKSQKWIDEAYSYLLKQESVDARIDFVEIFCLVLAVFRFDKELCRFVDLKLFGNAKIAVHRAAVIYIARHYSMYKTNEDIPPETLQSVLQQYSWLQSSCCFLSVIMGEALRTFYYTQNNGLEIGYACFRNAVELTSISGIKVVELVLVYRLAQYLEQMQEFERSKALMDYSHELWRNSGFTSNYFFDVS